MANVRRDSLLEIGDEKGFVIAPFDTVNGHPYLLIRPDITFKSDFVDKDLEDRVEKLEGRPPVLWPEGIPRYAPRGDARGHPVVDRSGNQIEKRF